MFTASVEAVAGLVFAVVPGFVATTAWSRSQTWEGPPSDLRLVLRSLSLSMLIHGALLPMTLAWMYPIRNELARHPGRVTTWALLVTVVVPLVMGVAAGSLSNYFGSPGRAAEDSFRSRVGRIWLAPAPPSVWDWFFTSAAPHGKFLVVTLRDGRTVAGVFEEGSTAMTSPQRQGLFLRREWTVGRAGDVSQPVRDSEGIMIRDVADVVTIRVLEVRNDGEAQTPVEGNGRGPGEGPRPAPAPDVLRA